MGVDSSVVVLISLVMAFGMVVVDDVVGSATLLIIEDLSQIW